MSESDTSKPKITLHARDPQVDALPEVRQWLEQVARAVEEHINQEGGFDIHIDKNMNPYFGYKATCRM